MPQLKGPSPTNGIIKTLASAPSKFGQILAAQHVLMHDVHDPEVTPMERAACVRAWDILEDRLRELRGRPKAGSRVYRMESDGRIIDVGAARPAKLRRRGRPPNTPPTILDVVAPSNEPGAAQSVDPA